MQACVHEISRARTRLTSRELIPIEDDLRRSSVISPLAGVASAAAIRARLLARRQCRFQRASTTAVSGAARMRAVHADATSDVQDFSDAHHKRRLRRRSTQRHCAHARQNTPATGTTRAFSQDCVQRSRLPSQASRRRAQPRFHARQ